MLISPVRASLFGSFCSILNVIFLFYGKVDRVFHKFVGKCEVPHFLYILNVMELYPCAILLWYLVNIFLVFLTHHDVGYTLPRSVISPVMAVFFLTLRCVRAEAMLVAIVMPADGPSFGVAPSGTWICMFHWSNSL